MSVPSRSNRNAGTGGWTYVTRSFTANASAMSRPGSPAHHLGPARAIACDVPDPVSAGPCRDKLPVQSAAAAWARRGSDATQLLGDPAMHVVRGDVPRHGGNGRAAGVLRQFERVLDAQ